MHDAPNAAQDTLVTIGLWLTYLLLAVAVSVILYYSFRSIFSNKEGNKKFFITAGILVALFVIGWAISPYDFKWTQTTKGVTPTNSGYIGGAIITVYFLLGIALASVIFFEIKRLFDKN